MKRWIALLLTALLLQTACSDRSRVSPSQWAEQEQDEVKIEEELDQQKDYPAERPASDDKDGVMKPEQEEQPAVPEKEAAEPSPATEENKDVTESDKLPADAVNQSSSEPSGNQSGSSQAVTADPQPQPQPTEKEENGTAAETNSSSTTVTLVQSETKAVWFSYFELERMLKGKSEAAFCKEVAASFDNLLALGMNTAIVQVRPYADAIYPSNYFEWSYLATGTEGEVPAFDPLKIMVREAHNRGLMIEAWINPYRIRNANYKQALSADNIVHSYLQSGDAVEYGGGLYFDPASSKAQQLIVNGVKEIVENYAVDGIHFDDYFYPTTDAAFDKASYAVYQKQGGNKSLAEWRRDNVNRLIKQVYKTVHTANPQLVFGISPQGNLENNYNKQFIDVALWLSTEGYVDYICPQIYFGFENETSPFAQTVAEWNDLIVTDKVRLLVGLSPYKVGTEDAWAGSGKLEWKNNDDLLSRMVLCARKEETYGGFMLFRYDSLFAPSASVQNQMKQEMQQLQDILK